jgi:CubicO group peptidase (beta-lactamase class C family)
MRMPTPHNRPVVLVAALLLPATLLLSCGGATQSDRYPLALGQQVEPQGLEAARAALAARPDVRSCLVERNGVVVMEEYFGSASAESFFDVRSITKSIVSVLVGIALERGQLRSLDQTVGNVLGPVLPGLDPAQQRISVRHLLTMTSGLPWRELGSTEQDYGAFVAAPDPLRWILDRPFDHEPGTYWHYNTGASHILSAILTETTRQNARDFAQEHLFGPLDVQVGPWPADSRGYNFGGHGISLTPRALVKVGRLFLDGGVFQGRRIVSPEWVRESTTARFTTGDAVTYGSGYGYLWWTGRESRTGQTFYFATGYGGQFIVNVPTRNATIVATTVWSGLPMATAGSNWDAVIRTIVETLIPSLR